MLARVDREAEIYRIDGEGYSEILRMKKGEKNTYNR